jgi:hypothetical protein
MNDTELAHKAFARLFVEDGSDAIDEMIGFAKEIDDKTDLNLDESMEVLMKLGQYLAQEPGVKNA